MRRSTSESVAGGEEERPLVISWVLRAEPFFKALTFMAVLESSTERVTRTPRGRRSVGAQVDVHAGVPVGEVGLP